MSIQLQPQKNFAIVRQLADPSDSTTYYVQAVIRNAETDVLIDTVNLTDKGDRRFIGIWRAIADVSGQGTLISVLTAVYTDAGCTIPSTVYGQEIETYLILERFNPNVIVSQLGPALGGDGVDIDYKKIRKIFEEVISKKITPLLTTLDDIEKGQGDDKSVIAQIKQAIVTATDNIKSAIPEKVDHSPIISSIDTGLSKIADRLEKIEYNEKNKDPIDLTPIIQEINNTQDPIKEGINEVLRALNTKFGDMFNKVPEVTGMLDTLHTNLNKKVQENTPKKDFNLRARQLLGFNVQNISKK